MAILFRTMTFFKCGCNLTPKRWAQARCGNIASVQQQWTRGKRTVAVLGAAGGIGQPLGLLMKLNPLVSDLRLYDIAGTPGVACDISHVNTQAMVCLVNKKIFVEHGCIAYLSHFCMNLTLYSVVKTMFLGYYLVSFLFMVSSLELINYCVLRVG